MAKYFVEDITIYPYPNPALAECLMGPRLQAIVADYTARVAATYGQSLSARPRKQEYDKRGPSLASSISAVVVPNGGYKNDRWVGQVTIGAQYAAADEFGRKKYSQYDGSGALAQALYSTLPFRP
jgi:hypothetical protein